MFPRRAPLLPVLAFAAAFAGTARGAEEAEEVLCAGAARLEGLLDPAVADPLTGARLDYLSPQRDSDVEYVLLDQYYAPLEERRVELSQIAILRIGRDAVAELSFDAVGMRIHAVEELTPDALALLSTATDRPADAWPALRPLPFFHNGKKLRVDLTRTPILREGDRIAVRLRVTVEDPASGLHFKVPVPGDRRHRPEVWSQGQTEGNRHWIISPDAPNEFFLSEQRITAPREYTAIGNGAQLSRTENADGTATTHFRMNVPHAGYLTSVIVGTFDRVEERAGRVLLEYFGPPGSADDLLPTYGRTKGMIAALQSVLGVPFPYPRYATTSVQDFSAGGMENITATTMMDYVLLDHGTREEGVLGGENFDRIVAHELGHQWFGDLVTCRHWVHIWLNEGWASYTEGLWLEHAAGRDAYEYDLWRRADGIARNDSVDDPRPLVWTTATAAWAPFGFKGSAVYNKGAYVLHMLRQHVGDDAFFAGTAAYLERHRSSAVVTDDFRRAIEEAANADLEAWFRQWLHTPGTPQLAIAYEWDAARGEAILSVEQTQTITAAIPAFRGPADWYFENEDGDRSRVRFDIDARSHRWRVPLDEEPRIVAFDPDGAFLSGRKVKMPMATLAETARRGPTAFARLDAIRALRDTKAAAAVEPLRAIATEAKAAAGERKEAVKALGKLAEPAAEKALLAFCEDATMSRFPELPEALTEYTPAAVRPALLKLAAHPREAVARKAVEALGTVGGDGALEAIVQAWERGGQGDRLRRAAVDALGRLGDPAAQHYCIAAAGPENHYRTRADALGALVALAHRTDDRREALKALRRLSMDENETIARRAIAALGELRDDGARAILKAVSERHSQPTLAAAAELALEQLDEPPPPVPGLADTEKKIDEELRATRALAERVRSLEN